MVFLIRSVSFMFMQYAVYSLLLHEIWKQYYASKKYVMAGNTCVLHCTWAEKLFRSMIEGDSVSSKKDVEPTVMLLKQRKWKSGIIDYYSKRGEEIFLKSSL